MITQEPATRTGAFRTRIAPTPSGFLHLGNVLSFALTAALAARARASILLRIDDLDSRRVERRYVEDIFDTLNFLEIPWTEGPKNYRDYQAEYSQRHRLKLYNTALQQLQETGRLFACTCSRSEISRKSGKKDIAVNTGYPGTCLDKDISADTPGSSWRLRTAVRPSTGLYEPLRLPVRTWGGDKDRGGEIVGASLPPSMSGFVVRRKDGVPAYQLASLIDDLYFGINLIVRGEDLWDSTLAQLHLASVLPAAASGHASAGLPDAAPEGGSAGMPGPAAFIRTLFYHHPLLKTASGQKLSKSAGDISIRHLRQEGLKPSAIYARIGKMLGGRAEVNDWKTLAATVLTGHDL